MNTYIKLIKTYIKLINTDIKHMKTYIKHINNLYKTYKNYSTGEPHITIFSFELTHGGCCSAKCYPGTASLFLKLPCRFYMFTYRFCIYTCRFYMFTYRF